MKLHAFTSTTLVENHLTDYILDIIKSEFIERGDHCILAVSGGSTPKDLYAKLANEFNNLQKKSITIIQVDERFVESNDKRSNRKMILEQFDTKKVNFVFMPSSDEVDSLEEAQLSYEKILRKLLKKHSKKTIDICLLGMGTDGHTASLFPKNQDYINQINGIDQLVLVTEEPTQPEPRISLTNHAINSSKHKILLIFGEEKTKTLKDAIFKGNMETYPILSVLDDLVIFTDLDEEVDELAEDWHLTNISG